LDEVCPNCGEFVETVNEITGFCISCSNDVGVFSERKAPTNISAIDLNNLDSLLELTTVICKCCGEAIPRATPDRHFFCKKNEICRKARRYYAYLIYEKGIDKDNALSRTLIKFKKE
jgi:hypothetical protein